MGMLTDGVAWLNDVLDEQVGEHIVYSRATLSATLIATIGRTAFESDNEFGVLRIESRDYILTRSRLDAAGFGEPQRGDRITETINGEDVTYEVLDMAGVMPWEYSDQGRTRVRIQTKRIKTQ